MLAGPSLAIFSTAATNAQCITKSSVLFCIDCESHMHAGSKKMFGVFLCLFYVTVLNCGKSQVPPIKCKSWLSPLEWRKYPLLGITENILSPRDVRKLTLSVLEYLEKNEWGLLLL